jgi:dihydroorotate dehydrogenase
MFYEHLFRPWLFRKDPEKAHQDVMARLAKWRLGLRFTESLLTVDDSRLGVKLFDLTFRNPVGLAAGLDKHGEALRIWQSLGFGFTEIGTVTPQPEDGNPRPRLFRLVDDHALINRLGFNSVGAQIVFENLSKKPRPAIPLGINIGKNKETPTDQAARDFIASTSILHSHADYFVFNISSPNTVGLRDLQNPDRVGHLVSGAKALLAEKPKRSRSPLPLLVKLAPDFQGNDLEDTVEAAIAGGADGFVATNTTIQRCGLHREVNEAGGLSGPPLRKLALSTLRRIYRATRGRVPIIGVGGISSAEDAFERICAGASLVQVYTGLIYDGPTFVRYINRGLVRLLSKTGLSSISAAVGRDAQ